MFSNTYSGGIDIFLSNVNIGNVNCVRATAFIFDTRTDFWVFGYVGALTGSTVIWYLFIVCNSLQSLFICIAFLCNSKVHKLLSACHCKSLAPTLVISSTINKRLSKQRSTSFPDKRKV